MGTPEVALEVEEGTGLLFLCQEEVAKVEREVFKVDRIPLEVPNEEDIFSNCTVTSMDSLNFSSSLILTSVEVAYTQLIP